VSRRVASMAARIKGRSLFRVAHASGGFGVLISTGNCALARQRDRLRTEVKRDRPGSSGADHHDHIAIVHEVGVRKRCAQRSEGVEFQHYVVKFIEDITQEAAARAAIRAFAARNIPVVIIKNTCVASDPCGPGRTLIPERLRAGRFAEVNGRELAHCEAGHRRAGSPKPAPHVTLPAALPSISNNARGTPVFFQHRRCFQKQPCPATIDSQK